MITQTYNLNLIPDKVPVIVNCSQYDALSRTIEMVLFDGSVLYSIPNGVTASVRGTKIDNTGFEYSCTISGSKVSFDITDQMTLYPGKVPCEIRLADSNGIIGTCNFLLDVEETTLDPDITISESDLPLLETAEQNAIRAEEAADRAEGLLDTKQDVLTAGTGIQLDGATISNIFASIADVDLNDIKYNYRGFVFRATNYPGVNANGVLDSIFVPPSGVTPSHGMQIFKTYNSDKLYYRSYNTNTSTWGSWAELYSTSSLTAGDGINITSGGVISNRFTNLTGVDLNTVKYNCVVWCNDACTNLPKNYGGMLLCCFSSNNSSYGTQILASYSTSGRGVFYRRCNGGTWTDWLELVSDFGTATITMNTSLFTAYASNTAPKCQKSGRIVFVRGVVKPTQEIANGGGDSLIGTIPSGYRPVDELYFVCQGSYAYRWTLKISTNGEMQIERYGNGSTYANVPVNTWLPFNVTYII